MYFPRDVSIWKRVNHPRITPFIGYTKGFNDRISFCSVTLRRPANFKAYTTIINPQADRFTLLCQALEGLVYLHTFSPSPIVHGALKPENILVTDEGNAELCTFGYAKFWYEVNHGTSIFRQPREFYHYITPDDDLTPGTDIYATGLTILYALSGKDPWHHIEEPVALLFTVGSGQLPKWADHPMEGSEAAVEKTWGLLKRCWHMSPDQRPSAQEVLDELLAIKALGGVRPPTSN
ncbi:hypothetical protein M407DRAFT_162294 [Tulasnella calospora MUT 4182]|uniref:Protein kinase domain-containing protein n=1 Tax=Tulasnella calospora MUT 4182 TaxID=1051891 RepID=A0A0C3L7E5_9AGAM|nr:hypothetical protein M407DRAFT_162294 [Tulasnella calospora MUT 4182]